MGTITLESLADQVANLQLAVNELLNRVRGPVAIEPPAPDGMVRGKQGHFLPKPLPEAGEMFAGYILRAGTAVGLESHARRIQGSMFLAGQTLLDKHGGDWVDAAEEALYGDPMFKPDPRWADYRPG